MTETIYYAKIGSDVSIAQRIRELYTPQGQVFEKALLISDNGEVWSERAPREGIAGGIRIGNITDLIVDPLIRKVAIPPYSRDRFPVDDIRIANEFKDLKLVLYSQDLHLRALRTVLSGDSYEFQELQ